MLLNPYKAVGCAAGMPEPRLTAGVVLANSELADAATFSDSEGIVRLSTAAAELQKKIDADFAQLETVTSEHDQKSSELEDKLSA